jgi:signal transduction protein with GAF and PtsI domain
MSESDVSQLRVVYSARPVPKTEVLTRSIGPLLEICLAQTNAQGAYVYQLNPDAGVLELVAWRGPRPTEIQSYQVQVDRKATVWYLGVSIDTVIEAGAWRDWRFQNLPECLHNRFESAVSVPILEDGQLAGIANFCRQQAGSFGNKEVAFLGGLSLPLGSLLTGPAELERLNQKLADRKLLDRAKGILQSRFGWSEEESYYYLRRTSRQSRKPMRDIARHVIQNSVLPSPWREAELDA